ncbi:MAG: C4-dicarboxylate ABC transporter substrate-binding protein, partial [Kangiellaceae bacterium]
MTLLKTVKKLAVSLPLVAVLGAAATTTFAQEVTLRGASMFDDKHAFTKTMVKFGELVDQYYDGDVKFDLRLNGELGVEKDYANFLQQGVAIDYTI